MSLAFTRWRVLHQEHNKNNRHNTENGRGPQAPLPAAQRCGCVTADHVAKTAAHRDGKVEDCQGFAARVVNKHVWDDGGRNGWVAGLADTDHGAGPEERPEIRVRPAFVLKINRGWKHKKFKVIYSKNECEDFSICT